MNNIEADGAVENVDGQETREDAERRLGERLSELHAYFADTVLPGYEEKKTLHSKYLDEYLKLQKSDKTKFPWNIDVYEYMSPEDAKRFNDIKERETQLDKQIIELEAEIIDFVSKNNVIWTLKIKNAVPKSVDYEHSESFFTKIGEYEFIVTWKGYPLDPSLWNKPEAFRDSYIVHIEGRKEFQDTKEGLLSSVQIGKEVDFPSIDATFGVHEEKDGEFFLERNAGEVLDKGTQEKVKEQILILGSKLRERLGRYGF